MNFFWNMQMLTFQAKSLKNLPWLIFIRLYSKSKKNKTELTKFKFYVCGGEKFCFYTFSQNPKFTWKFFWLYDFFCIFKILHFYLNRVGIYFYFYMLSRFENFLHFKNNFWVGKSHIILKCVLEICELKILLWSNFSGGYISF